MGIFVFPIKIYIEDTDYGGVVHHSNYLKFFERARTEWMESISLGYAWQQANQVLFVIRAANLDYLKPVRLGDAVEVVSTISILGGASMTFEQHLRPAQTIDTILCKAEIKVVCIDSSFRPRVLPDDLLQKIKMGDPA